jgi:hypothetical protein
MKRYSPGAKKWIKVEVLNPDGQPTARRRRMETAFVQVPLKEAAAIAKVTNCKKFFVWLWLLHEAWRTKSTTASVSNGALEPYGINRDMKYRALKDIARTGAITIHSLHRHAVKVTVNEKFLSEISDSPV